MLVTTLTKRMAEDLTEYLDEHGVRVRYLHSDIDTVERMEIVRDLRLGKFDVLVGINLLREGLDMPEVSLVAILDADKEGFLRAERSLIQTIGRAARNLNGRAILYADQMTGSMKKAIDETNAASRQAESPSTGSTASRPKTVEKGRRGCDGGRPSRPGRRPGPWSAGCQGADGVRNVHRREVDADPKAFGKLLDELEAKMYDHAKNLEFEEAAAVRDELRDLRATYLVN